jgi:hypothetical protein
VTVEKFRALVLFRKDDFSFLEFENLRNCGTKAFSIYEQKLKSSKGIISEVFLCLTELIYH